jgi:predicted DNA-binding transcriptional regulator YafY
MSYKYDSLILILNRIDSGAQVTKNMLMDELEMKERTIFRYIKTLQVAGFPIYYDRKRETYAFAEGYSLRKPNITVGEALALALAKNVLKSFSEGIESSIESIEKKLAVNRKIKTSHIHIKTEEPSKQVSGYLHEINDAILNFQRLELTYAALSTQETTVRTIDPYYLFYHDGFWHLRAYCHLREEMRLFALDRIEKLSVLREYFVPMALSQDDELLWSFGHYVDGDPISIVLRFDREIREHVMRKKWHPSQDVKELKDGGLEMRLNVNGVQGIGSWILKWIPHVKVLEPKSLRQQLLSKLEAAIEKNR